MGCLRGIISIIGVFFLIVIVAAVVNTSRRATPPAPPATVAQAPAKLARPYAERIAEAEATLSKHDFTGGVETVDDVAASLTMLDVFAGIAAEVPSSDADKEARLAFTKHLRTVQRQVLPKLRDKYGPAMRQQLWEADGKAKTIGQGFRTVEFVAAAFAANRNIKSTFETLYPSLMRMRFTRAQFKWFDQADEVQYYTLKPPSDDDIVTWNGGAYIQVWPLPASN